MGRHLTDYLIEQTLKRGKGVGQFLGFFEHNGQHDKTRVKSLTGRGW